MLLLSVVVVAGIIDFDDSPRVNRSVSWKVRRSMKLLERNLDTREGQQALKDVAAMYYDGDLTKAKACVLFVRRRRRRRRRRCSCCC